MAEALFNRKTLDRQLASARSPTEEQLNILRAWASTIRDGSIHTQSETEIEDQFKERIVSGLLGYRPFNETGEWTVASKASIGSGVVDLAPDHGRAPLRRSGHVPTTPSVRPGFRRSGAPPPLGWSR